MPLPGEVNQAFGRAYQMAFAGALEASIQSFRHIYDVWAEPEKLSFKGRNGASFSFDFSGTLDNPFRMHEVFAECKGYSDGSNLLADYRLFLAKSYITSTDHERHRNDLFWFVTNVPFACSFARGIKTFEFAKAALSQEDPIRELMGAGEVDDEIIRTLVPRIGVFILTDSFLMHSEILYNVRSGDTIWAIAKHLHGGNVPATFGSFAAEVARRNNLPSPNQIEAGTKLSLRWKGIQAHSSNASGF